jgi:hypothetical protein
MKKTGKNKLYRRTPFAIKSQLKHKAEWLTGQPQ